MSSSDGVLASPSLAAQPLLALPALIVATGERASLRFLKLFAARIRNPRPRWPYRRTAAQFLACCARREAPAPRTGDQHMAARIGLQQQEQAALTVKQRLAAARHLVDWLVIGEIVPVDPATPARGPMHVAEADRIPVLEPAEARTVAGPIGLMVCRFARIGAALAMEVEDVGGLGLA